MRFVPLGCRLWLGFALGALVLLSGTAIAEYDAGQLSRDQAMRDGLLGNLKSAAVGYSFDYVTIYLPPGTLPNISTAVPVTHVRYSSTVLFAFNSAELVPGADKIIEALATTLLADKAAASILLVGHTDAMGENAYNEELSLRRGATVAARLRSAGVKDALIGVVPMGEVQPIATNASSDGRARNRRVEFFISDVPAATRAAVEKADFNPCFRNDQDPRPDPTACDRSDKRVPIYTGSTGRPTAYVEIHRPAIRQETTKPPTREPLPHDTLERPPLSEMNTN